ncbi:MAG: GNAT family N-acetyltransferase [Gemmatimonadaceae bacterium]
MTEPYRTPDRGADAVSGDTNSSLERGFVASLRWLVAEGDARGVRRIAVELRALQEALATLDETRTARDEQAKRSHDLEREVASAISMLGPGTAVNGNGSLVQRLARLRDRLKDDSESRRQLIVERDAWRSMTTLMTQTRAHVHELLEEAERSRDALGTEVRLLRDQVLELQISREHAESDKRIAEETLTSLRKRLQNWTGTVERALGTLSQATRELVDEHAITHPNEIPIAAKIDVAPILDALVDAPAPAPPPVVAPQKVRVRRTYLRLDSREQFKPGRNPRRQALWLLMPACTVADFRHLYSTVGAQWNWHDRDQWTDEEIAARLASRNVHVFRVDAVLNAMSDEIESGVGFVELEKHTNGAVEIVYFGLTKPAQGFGLGAWLLEHAVNEAWGLGATRVWLHTCTQDAPQAMPNYLARGFVIDREEEYDAS